MANDVIHIRADHLRRKDIAHRILMAVKIKPSLHLVIIHGRVFIKVDNVAIVKHPCHIVHKGCVRRLKLILLPSLCLSRHGYKEELRSWLYQLISADYLQILDVSFCGISDSEKLLKFVNSFYHNIIYLATIINTLYNDKRNGVLICIYI